jgi:hypothetical protein
VSSSKISADENLRRVIDSEIECVVESEKAREVAYHFVMAHEYEDGEHRREEKWTH